MFVLSRYTVSIILGTIFLLIAMILYISLGLTVIQDYRSEEMYKKTECTVRDTEISNMNDKFEWYKCPWSCTVNHTPDGLKTYCQISEFPCLKIVVDVQTQYGLKSAILHENPTKMQKYYDCSTYYCDRDSVVNNNLVNKFRKKYGVVGSKFPCYYNLNSLDSDEYDDDGQEHALLNLSYHKASYVNAWLWPSFSAFVGVLLFVYGFYFVFLNKKINSMYTKNVQQKRKLLNAGI